MSQTLVIPTENTVKLVAKHKAYWQIILENFLQHRLALISVGVIFVLCVLALSAGLISHIMGIDPDAQNILLRYGDWSSAHWLGTDEVGRDAMIRLLYGARVSLGVAFVSAAASMIVGILVGALAGYYGGFIDAVLMRVTDSFLALPLIPILILLAAMDFGKLPIIGTLMGGEDSSILKMIIIFISFSWMVQARLVRGAILSIRDSEYVLAAKTMGQTDFNIIAREILPNVMSPVIVSVTLSIGQNILFEAALSFLGLGIEPPTASWGNMLNNAMESIYYRPSLVVIPGLLILLIVMSFNFLGDGLQDAMDPKSIKR